MTILKDLTKYCDDYSQPRATIKPPSMTSEQYILRNSHYCIYKPDGTFNMNFVKRSWWHINNYGLLITKTYMDHYNYLLYCPLMTYMMLMYKDIRFVYLDGNVTNIKASNLMTLTDITKIDHETLYPNALTRTNVPLIKFLTLCEIPIEFGTMYPRYPTNKLSEYRRHKVIKHYNNLGFSRSNNYFNEGYCLNYTALRDFHEVAEHLSLDNMTNIEY